MMKFFYYQKAFKANDPFPEDIKKLSYLCFKNNSIKLAGKYNESRRS